MSAKLWQNFWLYGIGDSPGCLSVRNKGRCSQLSHGYNGKLGGGVDLFFTQDSLDPVLRTSAR